MAMIQKSIPCSSLGKEIMQQQGDIFSILNAPQENQTQFLLGKFMYLMTSWNFSTSMDCLGLFPSQNTNKQNQTKSTTTKPTKNPQKNNIKKINKTPNFSYFNMFQYAFVSTADHWNLKEATAVVNEQSDCPVN